MATRPPAPPADDDEETARPIPGTRALLSPDPEPDAEQTVIDRLRAVMATTPADRVKVKLYRVDPKTPGRLAWCQDYTPAEFEAGDLEMVRETWGPGAYQIRIIGATGIAARSDVTISAPLNANPAPAPQVAPDSGVSQALQMLAETQSAILQALQQRPDPMQQMMQQMQLLKTFRDVMGPTTPPVSAPVSSPVTQLQEMLTTMRLFKEAAKDIGGDESSEPSAMAMLPGLLDVVKTAMTPQQQQPFIPQPITIPASIEQPSRNPAPIPVPETSESEPMGILVLRGLMQQLLAMAAGGEPVENGAEFIADKLPDELLQYLDLPNWFDILASFAPDVRAHEQWIRDAKARADEMLNEVDEDTPGGPGDGAQQIGTPP